MKNLTLLLICLNTCVYAQKESFEYYLKTSGYFTKDTITLTENDKVNLRLSNQITSLVLKIPSDKHFEKSYILAANDTFYLKNDDHNNSETRTGSQLIIFKSPVSEFSIFAGEISGNTEFHLFNAGASAFKKKENDYRISSECMEPFSIPQSTWRNGLPNPIGSPFPTPVFHIIIHHSAGSNDVPNSEEEVRNIYLLHTQSNGYDDIGYNYLIDAKGVIYKGRDGKGVVEQDNVRGAHMCNKNDSTMAICLLGTFTSLLPTEAALQSLYNLASWKAAKNNIEVQGSTFHSVGPTSAMAKGKLLPNIAGHRDGCTALYTECPGQMLYDYLYQVKDNIALAKNKCVITGANEESVPIKTQIFINDRNYLLPDNKYSGIKLYNTNGQEIAKTSFTENVYFSQAPGFYFVEFEGSQTYKLTLVIY